MRIAAILPLRYFLGTGEAALRRKNFAVLNTSIHKTRQSQKSTVTKEIICAFSSSLQLAVFLAELPIFRAYFFGFPFFPFTGEVSEAFVFLLPVISVSVVWASGMLSDGSLFGVAFSPFDKACSEGSNLTSTITSKR